MGEVRVERRLAAILAADIAGYSRLMGEDEEGTLAALKAIRRELADPKIKAAAYAELGITVTYHQEGRALLESRPQPSHVADVRVGGGT